MRELKEMTELGKRAWYAQSAILDFDTKAVYYG
jgi:hypothetical protein